jgi:hypothetical protein
MSRVWCVDRLQGSVKEGDAAAEDAIERRHACIFHMKGSRGYTRLLQCSLKSIGEVIFKHCFYCQRGKCGEDYERGKMACAYIPEFLHGLIGIRKEHTYSYGSIEHLFRGRSHC